MKLKTPTFPRKGHHNAATPTMQSPAPPMRPPAAAAASPTAPAAALKKVAGGLNAPGRKRNAGAMIAGLAFIIIAGAMGASVASSFDDSIEVLVAERDIEEGESIARDDFRTVQIAAAAGDIEVMAPTSIDELVGRVAAGPIGEGSMIHPDQFANAYGEQKILIGATLEPNQYPAGGLKAGDEVRLIALAGRGSSSFDDEDGGGVGATEIAVGVVVDVIPLGSNNDLHISLRVPESSANIIVQLVSTDRISVGLLDEGISLDEVNPLAPEAPVDPQTVSEDAGE